jgi:ATP-binding cassette, subfamily B, bacterial
VPFSTSPAAFLRHYIRQYWASFAFMAGFMLVWAVNEALFPYFIKEIIDALSNASTQTPVWNLVWVPVSQLIGLWFFMEICMRVEGYVAVRTMPKFCKQIREDAFWHLTGHSGQFFVNHFAGNIANKINDLPRSSEYLVEQIVYNFSPVLFVFTLSMVLMAQVILLFTALVIGWFCLHVLVVSLNIKRVMQTSGDLADATSVVTGRVVDALGNILSMRLFGRRRHELNDFNHYQSIEAQKRAAARESVVFLNILLGALTFVLLSAVMALLLYGWQGGWVSVGEISLISMLTFTLIGLIWHLSFELSSFFKELGQVRAALAILRVPYNIVDLEDAPALHAPKGEIVFCDVTFGYQQEDPLFKNLNVTLRAGEKVGLVGFSGSGKTSFVNLIVRAFDPQKGSIVIDGQDIRDVAYESLARRIAFIPQDPTLFHRSLMENIRYGRLEATDDEVRVAATLAHADLFIKEMPEGYETCVGERGLKLSGGQRQRIAIARAALKDAPILILDEATSALDSVTERLIQDSFHEIMKGRTTLVIAHRLSTLQDMDRILVFHQGRLVEDGPCEDLLANKDGAFAKLWQMQNEGFLPEKA